MSKTKSVKIETTKSGTYRVRQSVHGVKYNCTFKKKKEALEFRKGLVVLKNIINS